jgi:hypothetical protein
MKKEDILARIDDKSIYEHYIGTELRKGKKVLSPLRGEKHASFNIFYSSDANRWLFKDFNGESGDVFKFVMLWFNVDFVEALKIIAHDFGLEARSHNYVRAEQNTVPSKISSRQKFEYILRPFDKYDELCWNRYDIEIETIKTYNGFGCKEFSFFNAYGLLTVKTAYTNPLYVFINKESKRTKFYKPLETEKKKKFIGNTDGMDVFGWHLVNPGDCILWCAGQKDTMKIYQDINSYFDGLDFRIIPLSTNSENTPIEFSTFINLVNTGCKQIMMLDPDKAGLVAMSAMDSLYGIPYIDLSKITQCNQDYSEVTVSDKTQIQKIISHIISQFNLLKDE